MNRLTEFLKKFNLGQVVTLLIVGVALFLTTACNPGNEVGARPNNPPVQMGGNNNPHSMGGDGYTEYKSSTDPKTTGARGNHASINLLSDQVIAVADIKSNGSDLLYPGSDAQRTSHPDLGARGQAIRPEGVQSNPQRVINRSDPNEKILERIGHQFEQASEFLSDMGDSSANYPELQSNPALGK